MDKKGIQTFISCQGSETSVDRACPMEKLQLDLVSEGSNFRLEDEK